MDAREALRSQGKDPSAARQASALDLPFETATFDTVVAIGSLHHTGDLHGRSPRCASTASRRHSIDHGLQRSLVEPSRHRSCGGCVVAVTSVPLEVAPGTNVPRCKLRRRAPRRTDFVARARRGGCSTDSDRCPCRTENLNAVTVFRRTVVPRMAASGCRPDSRARRLSPRPASGVIMAQDAWLRGARGVGRCCRLQRSSASSCMLWLATGVGVRDIVLSPPATSSRSSSYWGCAGRCVDATPVPLDRERR